VGADQASAEDAAGVLPGRDLRGAHHQAGQLLAEAEDELRQCEVLLRGQRASRISFEGFIHRRLPSDFILFLDSVMLVFDDPHGETIVC